MVTINKRTSMALFSDAGDHYCQRVRIVLEEKGISAEVIDADKNNLSNDILEVSPYATLPVLVDRDVALYDSITLMEYLDERFPHPPLLPVYPVARANIRLYIKRITNDWCSLFDTLVDDKL
ncbi:MAG TPA: stringent starvation protein A, partial [Gammaproteobacteria bacterium]|nr:stringent starvation protein A [Gammaproteobacteria bacterium]